jgi:hypothetical protein
MTAERAAAVISQAAVTCQVAVMCLGTILARAVMGRRIVPATTP